MDSENKCPNTNLDGTAFIKAEYLFYGDKQSGEPEQKVPKLDAEIPSNKKKKRGQNKNRYFKNRYQGDRPLCKLLLHLGPGEDIPPCNVARCKDQHDLEKYLESKPPDIGSTCYAYVKNGFCVRGLTCRFGSSHTSEDGRYLKAQEIVYNDYKEKIVDKDVFLKLRKKTYDFKLSEQVIADVKSDKNEVDQSGEVALEGSPCSIKIEENKSLGPCSESSTINIRERKVIDWKSKLYLAPLTTLGNLPFRRICKEWGADVTCSEMALVSSLLHGNNQEWALMKRHHTEDLFGVQICGFNHSLLTRCAQLIEEVIEPDFIDLNLGCPIEAIYRKGGGSGMLGRQSELKRTVNCLSRVCSIPITVKTRSGVYENKPVAHLQMPIYSAAGVSLVTVHGRSREQRYYKYSDWDYIDYCAKSAAPTPVFGSGDILTTQDYNQIVEKYPRISGVMIGRGALYKPWIFTEIKENRNWDISSSERFDILKKYVNYGFEHWGSDTRGVETTRRFLLEWLSFLYRYIPLGLLESPQRMNQRPPRYIGRDDMETLMASANCEDWVKISEMLCGPVPEGFQFVPKHKANAWSAN